MYTIRILTPHTTAPFDIICDNKDLASAVHLASGNGKNQFKVFMSGAQVMPKHFGWGEMPGFKWVALFDHEEVPAPKTILCLEILYKDTLTTGHEFEMNEERIWDDTPQMIEDAKTEARNLNKPQAEGDEEPDVYPQSATLRRMTLHDGRYLPGAVLWALEWDDDNQPCHEYFSPDQL